MEEALNRKTTIHQFVTASAKTFSARTCPDGQVFLSSVCQPSPLAPLSACVLHPSVPDINGGNAAEDMMWKTHTTE